MNPDRDVGLCGSNEFGSPLSQKKDAAEKVFSNTLIWKIIGSYLNVGDLKACRLVNSGFHGMIMNETNFLQRCVVSLKPDQITRNDFGSTSDELWKNVLLNFESPRQGSYCNFSYEDLKKLDWLYPVIANVESLSLRMKKGTKGGNFFPVLKRLLLAPKKLRSLAMEPIFLLCGTAGNLEELKEVLANLEEFEILQPSYKWVLDIEGLVDKGDVFDPWKVCTDFIKMLENLRVAKSYCPHKLLFIPHNFSLRRLEPEVLECVLTPIARISSKTLKHVTLGEHRLWYQNGLFVETLPMIQELDFYVMIIPLPMEILKLIEHYSDSLQKLKIECWGFEETNWEVLEKTKLEEFQLGVLGQPVGNTLPKEAPNYLPSTLRRLFLRGQLQSNPVPALTRLNPTLVTELTFIDNGDCFEDDAIKYIRENFAMLRKLNVTNAKRVTDAGFIGCPSGLGSFSGIKGLRTLIVRGCGSITDATLKEIRFLELCYLDLAYNEKLTEDGIERVLSNNPSLETLLTSCKNVHHKRNQLCASHPRLSSVIYRGLKAKKQASLGFVGRG